MGLSVHEAAMIAKLSAHLPRRHTALCLGVPHIDFSVADLRRWSQRLGGSWQGTELAAEERPSAAAFFRSLGFERFLALDVSDYEGAQIVHDLNAGQLPVEHHGVADLVFNGGTLEHVFHLPNALTTIHELLRVEGMVVHSAPCNGYLDHGFYQLCPTLFYDYYSANQYRVLSANVINRHPALRCEPYREDIYRQRGPLHGPEHLPRALAFFAAGKTAWSTSDVVPMQSFYRDVHEGQKQVYVNEHPFEYGADGGGPHRSGQIRRAASALGKLRRRARTLSARLRGVRSRT